MSNTTILFGGPNRERLVSVASAQALTRALPDADLWFWAPGGAVQPTTAAELTAHQRPFELDFQPAAAPLAGDIAAALDRAKADGRVLLLGMHGGPAENGELAGLAEARGVPFTGSGAAASRLAFDKAATKRAVAAVGVTVVESFAAADAPEAFAKYGRLVAKPVAEGSSYGLIFVNSEADLAKLADAATREAYLVEPFVAGIEATVGVLDLDGQRIALPPVEIQPDPTGGFDYAGKYLSAATREICPGNFNPADAETLKAFALKAHQAVGALGYSRTDFIVTPQGPVFLEINTLPGLTAASLYPKALAAGGVAFQDFLRRQLDLAKARYA